MNHRALDTINAERASIAAKKLHAAIDVKSDAIQLTIRGGEGETYLWLALIRHDARYPLHTFCIG